MTAKSMMSFASQVAELSRNQRPSNVYARKLTLGDQLGKLAFAKKRLSPVMKIPPVVMTATLRVAEVAETTPAAVSNKAR